MPQLTALELNFILKSNAKGMLVATISEMLQKRRSKKNQKGPDETAVRRFLRGGSHLRGGKETRGRKRIITPTKFRTMEKLRKKLVKDADGEKEITQTQIRRKARVKASNSTISRAFKEKGVKWRPNREKPQRSKEHMKEREQMCTKWKRLPKKYFSKQVDLIIDNKKFDAPASRAARKYLAKQKVRGQMRKRSEGLKKEYTRPNKKKHRINPGSAAHVTAGLSGDQVVLWEEIKGRWNGQKAADMYTGPIKKALEKHRPNKKAWKVLEDNDPSGYSSGKAKKAKKSIKLNTLKLPRYSPDLNPWDFTLWKDILDRMDKSAPLGKETVKRFKKRLRLTALRTPKKTVRKAVASMPRKIAQVAAAKGGNIKSD